MVVCIAGLTDALAWMVPGISSSTTFSHSGYHHSSPSEGVKGSLPPASSGLILQATNPCSLTQRSSSSTQLLGLTLGDWGSWHTGETLSGKRRPIRAIRSLQASLQ